MAKKLSGILFCRTLYIAKLTMKSKKKDLRERTTNVSRPEEIPSTFQRIVMTLNCETTGKSTKSSSIVQCLVERRIAEGRAS